MRCLSKLAPIALLLGIALLACQPAPPPRSAAAQNASGDDAAAAAGASGGRTDEKSSATAPAADPDGPGATEVPETEDSAREPSAEEAPGPDARSNQPDPPPIPVLVDPEGESLPQTEARPSVESKFFQWGAEKLFEAIVADDSESALPFFFPKLAYEQVKDIAKPGRDWEYRLVGAFKRNIHEYHRQLGKYRDEATFERVEVDASRAEWMKPGSEGNRLGYYRVLRSRLFYRDRDGKEHQLGITSMISWRGEWYVVHLNGFK